MIVTGIDLSSQPKHTGLARLHQDAQRRRLVLDHASSGADDEQVRSAVVGSDRCGVDVPFGWPAPFADLIVAHRNGEVTAPLAVGPAWHRPLALRATDAYVRERTGLTPLSVSTDKIAYPALRWVHLAARLGQDGIDVARDGTGAVCEVYPAAVLRQWNLPHQGYKKAAGRHARATIIEGLTEAMPWLDWNGHEDTCLADADVLDAVLCAIIATQVHAGNVEKPPPHLRRLASEEGWICLPAGPPKPPW